MCLLSLFSIILIGIKDKTEETNRTALKIAREVAIETGTLFAGGISNVDYDISIEEDKYPTEEVTAVYEEQVRWSKEEGVDYVIAETLWGLRDAKIALEVIKSFDLPAVVTMAVRNIETKDGVYMTRDGIPVSEACRLVGVNCTRGPATMIEVVEQICQVIPSEKVCALHIAQLQKNQRGMY